VNEISIPPTVDADSSEYWEGTRRRLLMIQRCTRCGRHQFYPRILCRRCLSTVEWIASTGRGRVYSCTTIHRATSPVFQSQVPYVIALIDLTEGVRVMGRIVGCPPQDVRIGQDVVVAFGEAEGAAVLPHFVLTDLIA
jgi:uncharacterized OB-fold protein